ncbi:MAG: hypothetical protein M3R27_08900 [Bacteroidota bacterium]|nr:hypothetical protein [Bacteroidota bacterium]
MPTRKEISKIRAEFITLQEKRIKRKITGQEKALYDKLVELYLENNPKGSAATLQSLNKIEKEIAIILSSAQPEILMSYVQASKQLNNLSEMYFATLVSPERLIQIKEKADKVIDKKFGLLPDGSLKEGGFIDRAMKDPKIQKDIIKNVRKAIANGADLEAVKNTFREIIAASPEEAGILQKYYNTISKDILSRIDNGNNKIYADELDLQHAVYQGGLIRTSRSLCLKNNGKIFTREQIEDLRNDPFIKEMFSGKMNEYDPFEQPGGYGCLHSWDWITADLVKGILRSQNKKATQRNNKFIEKNNL